jgi:hypothetical protein
MKNIPIPSKQEFHIQLISSVEKFMKNLSWRAFHFLNPSVPNHKETFGFNSTKRAPHVAELKDLKNELFELTQNIKFKEHRNAFQNKLKKDEKDIEKENRMIIPADKTSNYYKVVREDYDELLQKNITKDYKKATEESFENTTKIDKEIATKLSLEDRIYKTSKRQAFVSLKDHKPNFQNKPTCRLLNPTKPELGKISQQILAKIVKVVREKTNLNSWKNTDSVITWFKAINNKDRVSFITYDVCDFYASITEEVLTKSLDFASDFIEISDSDREIIFQARKTFLFDNKTPWNKKNNSEFDVGMGSFDGAEVCDLIGLFMLSQLKHLKVNLGKYRDDALGVTSLTPRQADLAKKDICRIYKQNGFSITIEVNIKVVNFLDITLDLRTGLYMPFMKPNNCPIYINKNSNHPQSITRNIPEAVNRRLCSISANENVFNDAAPPYQAALEKSGHTYKLKYVPPSSSNSKRCRSRKITWFNPHTL